jgi:glucosamine-phosphate N-acetyltransferase
MSKKSYRKSSTYVFQRLHPPFYSHPPAVQIRPLSSTDYDRGHLSVLSVLTETPDVGADSWESQFQDLRDTTATYYIVVVVSRDTDRIVASGGVFIERKFLRGLGRVGHIEDIAVSREMQGKKLGLRIIQALTHISEGVGCYKTILNCSDTNIRAFIVFVVRRAVSLILVALLSVL